MSAHEYRLHNSQGGAAIAVRITPRASKNEIVEVLNDGTVRVRLTSSGADEKSNAALLAFLAEVLEIPASNMEIVAGATGKDKLISIINLDAETVHQRILHRM